MPELQSYNTGAYSMATRTNSHLLQARFQQRSRIGMEWCKHRWQKSHCSDLRRNLTPQLHDKCNAYCSIGTESSFTRSPNASHMALWSFPKQNMHLTPTLISVCIEVSSSTRLPCSNERINHPLLCLIIYSFTFKRLWINSSFSSLIFVL